MAGSGPSNSNNASTGRTPSVFASIPEDTALAWIEGELSPAQVSELAARYPEAVQHVARLKRDRAEHASLKPERAPAGLSDRVLAALEREALLGLADGTPLSDSLPISQVAKARSPRQATWARATPRLAMAAGFTLLASSAVFLLMRSGNQPTESPPPDRVATTSKEQDPSPSIASKVAANENDVHSAESGSIAAATVPAEGLTDSSAQPIALASEHQDISVEQAVALAKEGRLVIRVRHASASALARLDTSRGEPAKGWNLKSGLAETTIAALATPREPVSASPTARSVPAAVAAARSLDDPSPFSLSSPFVDLQTQAPSASGIVDVPPAGFIADARLDAEVFESMRASLARLPGVTVEFAVSPEPVRISAPATAESVLWWTQSPRTWAPRVLLPVIAERD